MNVDKTSVGMRGCDSGGGDIAYTQTAGTVNLNGTLDVQGTGGADLKGGALGGSGTLTGNLLAEGGLLSPGNSPGTITVTGNYTQTSLGKLLIQLGGTGTGQFDVLAVGGTATLGGTLDVELYNGFTPQLGDTFAFLTASSISSDFTTFTGLDIGNGLQLEEVFSPDHSTLSLEAVSVPEPGTLLLLLGLFWSAAIHRRFLTGETKKRQ